MRFKNYVSILALVSMVITIVPTQKTLAASSAYADKIYFNEIAWSGSSDSSSDEWIELYNASDTEVDISGWKIIDDQTTEYLITAGIIPPKSYFLIEDNEDAVKNITADAVINLSLANSGDSLLLYDSSGNVVDKINETGGAWYAGSSSNYASMEKSDFTKGDSDLAWKDAEYGNGSFASGNSPILGTPKSVNSGIVSGVNLSFEVNPVTVAKGQEFNVKINSGQISDLFAYGFDLNYDPAILELVAVSKGSFLNYFGNEDTVFQQGLLGGVAGKLVVAEARTNNPKTGISGEGNLFELKFKVIGDSGSNSQVVVDRNRSFLADKEGNELSYNISALDIVVGSGSATGTVNKVTNLKIVESEERYELKLSWDAALGGVDSYKIFRKGVDGTMLKIADVNTTEFVDKDGIEYGGNIIPFNDYYYEIVAVKSNVDSEAQSIVGFESRGLKADINHDDRVDGRDLNELAQSYGLDLTFPDFNRKADLNYDGEINGSDLIDIAADWAKVYLP